MEDKEKKRASIWVYAVVLFTSAFIILLFTAVSQIRLNKYLDEYKNRVDIQETEKNLVQENFLSAQEMNKILNEKIDELNKKIEKMASENENLKKDKTHLETTVSEKDEAIKILMQALSAYNEGDVAGCAALIKKIDRSAISGEQEPAFNELAQKVYSEAGRKLFNEGYYLFRDREYEEAVKKFLLSYEYAPVDEFSDKCLYYLAYCEMRINKTEDAIKHMNMLIKGFPDSKYVKYAEDFIERYGQP